MEKCNGCRKEKDKSEFTTKRKQFKKCNICREKSRQWKKNNKERVSEYNKLAVLKRNNYRKEIEVVYGKLIDDDDAEWVKYESQVDVARKLDLYKPNINKVIKGSLKSTGGYVFKVVTEIKEKEKIQTWKELKKEKSIENKTQGKPAKHRVLHKTKKSVVGKECCTCKNWKQLSDFNKQKSHWDGLRNDCKSCLVKYRKVNRRKIQDNMNKYEKHRKLIDPAFKLSKTLRSRLGSALKNQNAEKSNNTMELIGCTIPFLQGYLTAKFKPGMTWDNHGDWHIDHIKPCAKFNLIDEEEQQKCFHYTNLQPLWAEQNLIKSDKFIE